MLYVGLVLSGVVAGTWGSIIGAGGGFILVPLLLFVLPGESACVCTAISASISCINWKLAISLPNCLRLCAYSIEASRQAWAAPILRAQTPRRALSKADSATAIPLPTLPSTFSAGIGKAWRIASATSDWY